jgi:hypothetical protein
MFSSTEWMWFFLTSLCLLWAAIEDIKHRIVPDKVWLIQISLGIVIFFKWLNEVDSYNRKLIAVINILMGISFFFITFLGGFMGGGDSKAILAISISSPMVFGLEESELPDFPAILHILTNMGCMLLMFGFILLLINLIQRGKYGPLFSETSGTILSKLYVLLSGHRVVSERLSDLEHEDPLEVFENDQWKLHTPIFVEQLEDEEFEKMEREARIKAAEDAQSTNRSYLWVRPQPPGMVFFLLGYLLWVFIGSPLPFFLKQLVN